MHPARRELKEPTSRPLGEHHRTHPPWPESIMAAVNPPRVPKSACDTGPYGVPLPQSAWPCTRDLLRPKNLRGLKTSEVWRSRQNSSDRFAAVRDRNGAVGLVGDTHVRVETQKLVDGGAQV